MRQSWRSFKNSIHSFLRPKARDSGWCFRKCFWVKRAVSPLLPAPPGCLKAAYSRGQVWYQHACAWLQRWQEVVRSALPAGSIRILGAVKLPFSCARSSGVFCALYWWLKWITRRLVFFRGCSYTLWEKLVTGKREESSAYQPLEDGGGTTVISIASI